MYAVILTGGKQIKVKEGDAIFVEKIEGEDGSEIVFNEVLMIVDDTTMIGTPLIEKASVVGKIEKQGKGKKLVIFKYRAKKNFRKKQGHRQPYTKVLISKINK